MGGFRSLSGRCPVVIVGVAGLSQGRLVQVRLFGVQGIVAHSEPRAFGGAHGPTGLFDHPLCDLGDAEVRRGTPGPGQALEDYVSTMLKYSFVSDDLEEAL